LYGRTPIIHAGNIIFTVFQIGCAEANSIGTLIALRLFAGIGGSAVLSVGGGVIADAFPKEKMGGATAAFSIGPLLGPVIGPVMYSIPAYVWTNCAVEVM
jgi:MFS family permease